MAFYLRNHHEISVIDCVGMYLFYINLLFYYPYKVIIFFMRLILDESKTIHSIRTRITNVKS